MGKNYFLYLGINKGIEEIINKNRSPHMTEAGICEASRYIRGLISLKSLNLGFCRCSGDLQSGVKKLGRALKTLSSLQDLKLSFEL